MEPPLKSAPQDPYTGTLPIGTPPLGPLNLVLNPPPVRTPPSWDPHNGTSIMEPPLKTPPLGPLYLAPPSPVGTPPLGAP